MLAVCHINTVDATDHKEFSCKVSCLVKNIISVKKLRGFQ